MLLGKEGQHLWELKAAQLDAALLGAPTFSRGTADASRNAHVLSLFQVMDGDQTLIHNSSEDLATFLLLPVQHSPPLEQFFRQILR